VTEAGKATTIRKARFATADAFIAKGASLSAFAREIGLTPAGALFWLRRHDPDRLAALVNGYNRTTMTAHQVLVRLLLLKSCEGISGAKSRLCGALGIKLSAMCEFRKRWAPDGLDAAIADLMPDDGEAAHG
jgi:hypothetical protein